MKKFLNKKGSSLVEIIVSIALFAVVSIPMLSLFLGAASMLKQSKDNMKVSEIERHIKADIIGYQNELTAIPPGVPLLPTYTGNYTVSETSLLPTDPLIPTIDNYAIMDYEYNKNILEYKYSVTLIPNDDNGGLNIDRVFNNSTLNITVGTRYRINIYKLKSLELNPLLASSFKFIKSFYIETIS